MRKIILFSILLFSISLYSQVGINTTTPSSTLDMNGDLAMREGPTLTLVNETYPIINLPAGNEFSHYRITGPTLDFWPYIIYGGNNGQIITLINTTGQNMNIYNYNTASGGILTGTGKHLLSTSTGNSSVTMMYNATLQRWIVTSYTGMSDGNSWSLNGNINITTPAQPVTYGSSPIGATENFIGTKASNAVVIGTDNIERMRISQLSGHVGIGTSIPTLARLQTQGAAGNTVATFNLTPNSLGIAMVSDWPGIYFNSYYNAGIRQMSNNSYPAIFNYNPGGQFEFGLSNTANTIAGNIAGGTFSNRFVVHRDTGAYFSYNNTGITGLSVSSGGLWPDLAWYSSGATTATINNGIGIATAGENIGIVGRAHHNNTATTDKLGGVFYVTGYNGGGSWGFPAASSVGAVIDNTVYKIFGFGIVSTIVKDNNEKDRIMVAPEAPEALFQDYGIGKLINGYAKIDLDPILTKNIRVDNLHPLKVFIQLEGDCNGVFVTNKNATGFEVKELQYGSSNVSFSYQIVASRADEERAGVVSKYSDMRFKPLNKEFKEIITKRETTLNLSNKMTTQPEKGIEKLNSDIKTVEVPPSSSK